MTDRPRCAYCGKLAPKRSRTVFVHRTKDTRVKDGIWMRYLYVDTPLRSREDCQRHTNQEIISISYAPDMDANYDPTPTRHVIRFGEWDGESYYLRCDPFCSGTCEAGFAHAAYRAGYRMKGGPS